MEIFQTILTLLIGAAIASIGYLIKRRIEKTRNVERLNRAQIVLGLHKQMNDQGLTVTDLYHFEKHLLHEIKGEIEAKGFASLDNIELTKMLATYAGITAVLVQGMSLVWDDKSQLLYDSARNDFYKAFDFLVTAKTDPKIIKELEKATSVVSRSDNNNVNHDAPNNSFNRSAS